MKREAYDHYKIRRVAASLDIDITWARGLTDSLWKFAREYTPRGNIGKLTDLEIVQGIGLTRNPRNCQPLFENDYLVIAEKVIEAFVDAKLIDTHDEHRLIIHDWAEHVEDTVHMKLARNREFFCDGSAPSTSRLGKEKSAADKWYQENKPKTCASMRSPAQECALPLHSTPSVAVPSPTLPKLPADAAPIAAEPEPAAAAGVPAAPSFIKPTNSTEHWNALARVLASCGLTHGDVQRLKQLYPAPRLTEQIRERLAALALRTRDESVSNPVGYIIRSMLNAEKDPSRAPPDDLVRVAARMLQDAAAAGLVNESYRAELDNGLASVGRTAGGADVVR